MILSVNNKIDKPSLKISEENSNLLLFLTIKQLEKDFTSQGYQINYSGTPEDAYEHLLGQVRLIIEGIVKNGFEKLNQLLGSIELCENLLKESLHEHPGIPVTKIISKLILECEFKKVIARENLLLE